MTGYWSPSSSEEPYRSFSEAEDLLDISTSSEEYHATPPLSRREALAELKQRGKRLKLLKDCLWD